MSARDDRARPSTSPSRRAFAIGLRRESTAHRVDARRTAASAYSPRRRAARRRASSWLCSRGTWLTNATRGLSGPRRQREPDQHARSRPGRARAAPTSSGERAQDLQVLDEQPAHSVARAAWRKRRTRPRSRGRSPPTARSSSRGEPAKSELAVGEHEHAVGVALGLGDVVRREDDRRARAASSRPMNSHRRSRWRGSSAALGSSSSSTGGLGQQADRDVHALAVAARQRR